MQGPGEKATDLGLIREVAAGGRRAFDELVLRHRAALFRFARGMTGSDAVAEDVLQETLLAAYRNAGSFAERSSVRTWMFGICFRQAQKSRRRRVGEPGELEPLDELGVAAGWGAEDTPETLVARSRLRDCLSDAMHKLEEDDRSLLILRDLEGMPGAEVAEVLGVTVAAMKSRVHRARLRLAAEVRKAGCTDGA